MHANDRFAEIPKNYNINFTQLTPKNEFIFTENERGQAVGLSGKVDHEATVVPTIDDDYHRIMKQRSEEASKVTRSTLLLDSKQDKRALLLSARQGLIKKPKNTLRRDRLPENDLLDILFKTFEECNQYTLKELIKKTDQPMAYLKEILGRICILHRGGSLAGYYELKQEFKAKK